MGTALGLADEDDGQLLSEIETRKGGNEGKCFMEVVNVWLRGSGVGPKTWGTLLHCLKETEMNEAVRSIQENILHCKLNNYHRYTIMHCHGNCFSSLKSIQRTGYMAIWHVYVYNANTATGMQLIIVSMYHYYYVSPI